MKAHELLNSAEAWCQESPAEDRQGNKLQALDPRAVKWSFPIPSKSFRAILKLV